MLLFQNYSPTFHNYYLLFHFTESFFMFRIGYFRFGIIHYHTKKPQLVKAEAFPISVSVCVYRLMSVMLALK